MIANVCGLCDESVSVNIVSEPGVRNVGCRESLAGVEGGSGWGGRRVWLGWKEGLAGVEGGSGWGGRRVWLGCRESLAGVEGESSWEE